MDCEVLFYDRHSTKNNKFLFHTHDCYEIIYFLSGKGNAVINNVNYPFYPNSFCIIPPNTVHKECIQSVGEVIFMGFSYDNFEYKIRTGMYYCNGMVVNRLMQDVMKESNEKKSGYDIIVKSKLSEMMVLLSRMNDKATVSYRSVRASAEYLNDFYNKKIDFRELAIMSGYSYDYFRHYFKEIYGISPQNYLFEIRLKKAAEFLRASSLNCTEIGYICGFSSSSQFSKLFREKYGVSPKAYKKTDSD